MGVTILDETAYLALISDEAGTEPEVTSDDEITEEELERLRAIENPEVREIMDMLLKEITQKEQTGDGEQPASK